MRIYSEEELFGVQASDQGIKMFEDGQVTDYKQPKHTVDTVKVLELTLKSTLEDLCRALFGKNAEMRWVDAYFPFTHPSFELEVFYNGKWLEVLGCGIMEQQLLESAGAGDKVGWA